MLQSAVTFILAAKIDIFLGKQLQYNWLKLHILVKIEQIWYSLRHLCHIRSLWYESFHKLNEIQECINVSMWYKLSMYQYVNNI